jgi:hypothetical protein
MQREHPGLYRLGSDDSDLDGDDQADELDDDQADEDDQVVCNGCGWVGLREDVNYAVGPICPICGGEL